MPPKQDKPASLPPMPMPEPAPPEPVVAAPPKKAIDRVPVNEPSKQQQPIGQHTSTGTVLLESSPAEEPNWRIVPTKGDVLSGHWLVSLPGYRSDVKLNSGIDLVLWGNLLEFMPPEFIPMSPIESQAMIHQPAKGIEADVTLDHGRIVVKNPTANSVRVRLRFRGEVWDLTLEPKAETLIDGLVSYAPGQKFSPDDSGESPMTRLYVGVRLGKISVQIRDREPINLTQPPGPALLGWDNKGRLEDPLPLRESLPHWSETIPNQSPASDFRTVLDALSKRMS